MSIQQLVSLPPVYRYGVINNDDSRKRRPWDGGFLGKYEEPIRNLYASFTMDVNGTTQGYRRHFDREMPKWQSVVVAMEGTNVVGYVTLEPYEPQSLELSVLVVDEKHRRRGIAKRLINGAELVAREMGMKYTAMIIGGKKVHKQYMEDIGYRPHDMAFHRKEL